MKDFFISYNGNDKEWAEWIAWTLEAAGYTTVIQAWDFRAGGDFVIEMQNAATGTERTIAVLSDNYLNAEYTQPEWTHAFARDPQGKERTLLPVRIAPCHPKGLLSTRIYADLVGLSADDAKKTLLEALRERAKPDQSPSFPGTSQTTTARMPTTSEPSRRAFPGNPTTALEVWIEKREFLREHEAITSDPAQKFALKKQIEEAEAKIAELNSLPRS